MREVSHLVLQNAVHLGCICKYHTRKSVFDHISKHYV